MNDHLILGIETSGIRCSVAWWQNGSVLLEYNLERKNEHAVLLASLVEKGFKELGLNSNAVTQVVVGSGPGSFTGLRIGMSYGKGFCFGNNIPLIPVTNFELLSDWAENDLFPIYTLIEAGRGNYYTGVFNKNKSTLEQKLLLPVFELEHLIPDNGQVVVHEENSKGYFEQSFGKSAKIIVGQYRAARLCMLGYHKLNDSHVDLNEIEPLYLQKFAGVS